MLYVSVMTCDTLVNTQTHTAFHWLYY